MCSGTCTDVQPRVGCLPKCGSILLSHGASHSAGVRLHAGYSCQHHLHREGLGGGIGRRQQRYTGRSGEVEWLLPIQWNLLMQDRLKECSGIDLFNCYLGV